MVSSIEQFTAPGKYEYELWLEGVERFLNDSREIYIGLIQQPKETAVFKRNLYYRVHQKNNGKNK